MTEKIDPDSPNLFIRFGTRSPFVLGPYDTARGRCTLNGRDGELWWHRYGITEELRFAPNEPHDKFGQPVYWYEVADHFDVSGAMKRHEELFGPPSEQICKAAQQVVRIITENS